jgi:hypothetical protein
MTAKRILMTLIWALIVGVPSWMISRYTDISIIAPMGAAAGAAYGFLRNKSQQPQ